MNQKVEAEAAAEKPSLNSESSPKIEWSESALKAACSEANETLKQQERLMARAKLTPNFPFVGQSASVVKVFELIERVANTDSTVLILGESGTGKELVARALHEQSDRKSKAFVPVNCGAIPSELLESELFGHVKGAFTGAHSSRMGRFSLAHQGTLFLDEIGTMPASLQVKILRALQEREFEPVGSTKSLKSDCRVIAATNNDLEKEVSCGNFREDLFYRLNVIPISLPALRDRREDIPLLVRHFIDQLNSKKSYSIDGVSKEAMEALVRYPWPGNVRELENICQRLCILKGAGLIEFSDLPPKILESRSSLSTRSPWGAWMAQGFPEGGVNFDRLVEDFENELILKALESTRWNKNRAAQLLNMNRTTLVEKIKKRNLVQS
jgi:DNA-binding NtrC family response regulator